MEPKVLTAITAEMQQALHKRSAWKKVPVGLMMQRFRSIQGYKPRLA